jgi:hypothetical protein
MAKEIPAWVPYTGVPEEQQNDYWFALCVDGVVQTTMGVNVHLASIFNEQPKMVYCGPNASAGMTEAEASATLD